MIITRLTAVAVLPLVAAVSSTSEPPASPPPAGSLAGDVVVFAAASLTDAFEQLGDAFEVQHPDIDVIFNFGASSDLATAIVDDDAPADVFASADRNNIDRLVSADRHAHEPQPFATNSLEIIVEAGNPLGIESVEDLADPDIIFVTCDPAVPIGAYTQQVLDAAGVSVTPDSLEENVRGIVTKVTSGEADAGIVYATDVLVAGDDAEGVPIPADINILAEYPITAVADGPSPDGASAFVDFVLSGPGQQVLAQYGFGPADAAAGAVPSTDLPNGSAAASSAPAASGG